MPSRKFVLRVFQEIRYDQRNLWMFLVATVLSAIAHGVMASCAGLVGQTLTGNQLASSGALVDPRGLLEDPIFLCSVGLGAALVKSSSGALSVYSQKRASFQVGNAVRGAAITTIARQGQPAGQASASHATITVRIRDIERGVEEGVLAGFRALATLAPLFAALAFLSSKLVLFALLLLTPFALALGRTRKLVRGYHARSQNLAKELHRSLDALVHHLDLFRTYGATEKVEAALEHAGKAAGLVSARADATKNALSGANEVLAAAALLAVVALTSRLNINLKGGSLVAFTTVFFLTYRPLRDLGDARTSIERGAAALEALDTVLNRNAEPVSFKPTSVQGPPNRWKLGKLELLGLQFDLDGNFSSPLSLTVEPGAIVAILGPTGSGKTTLLRGLLGLWPASAGALRYASEELTRASVGPEARPFAWVPQEPAIVPGTILENVAIGAKSSAEEKAREALVTVGAQALLEARGKVTLSAGGHEISGGERQLVALARAVNSSAPVLLLDEPTSGLDPEAEARVLNALEKLRGKRTILLVTHRPAPLRIADQVISMRDLQDEPRSRQTSRTMKMVADEREL